MKRNLLYLIPFLIIGLASCSKHTDIQNYPVTLPSGPFLGTFIKVHKSINSDKTDTLKVTGLELKLDPAGTYSISGDTIVHAGSFGTFGQGYGNDLVFTDKTLPASGVSSKQHLNGDYLFLYDGTNMKLIRGVGDTISYQYYFSK